MTDYLLVIKCTFPNNFFFMYVYKTRLFTILPPNPSLLIIISINLLCKFQNKKSKKPNRKILTNKVWRKMHPLNDLSLSWFPAQWLRKFRFYTPFQNAGKNPQNFQIMRHPIRRDETTLAPAPPPDEHYVIAIHYNKFTLICSWADDTVIQAVP